MLGDARIYSHAVKGGGSTLWQTITRDQDSYASQGNALGLRVPIRARISDCLSLSSVNEVKIRLAAADLEHDTKSEETHVWRRDTTALQYPNNVSYLS